MEIIIGKTAGFCFGVSNAVDKAKEILKCQKCYCLGELVHNSQVTKDFIDKGLIIVDNLEDAKDSIIIRSHGADIDTYKKAKEYNLKLIDLTCPKVLKIHNIAQEFSKKNYYIFFIGQSTHPETIATISYCGENSSIIQNEEDIEKAIESFKKSKLEKGLVISQTTYSVEKFKKISNKIKSQTNNVEIKNTICNATNLRQEETKEIAKQVNMMIIVGGKHSSNTNKLYEISKEICNEAILIETVDELKMKDVIKKHKIGIMAGASTPKESINLVVEFLKQIC